MKKILWFLLASIFISSLAFAGLEINPVTGKPDKTTQASITVVSFDATDYGDVPAWGSGVPFTWTFNAGATDPEFEFGNGTLDINDASVTIHGAASQMTFANNLYLNGDTAKKIKFGLTGGSFNENLFLDLDTTSNTAAWSSSTGLVNMNFGSIALTLGTPLSFANGGTGLSIASDDTVPVSSGSAWVAKAVPNCTDSGGSHLNYTTSTNAFSCGTSGDGGGGALALSELTDVGTTTRTNGAILIANTTDWDSQIISGDITIGSTGIVTIKDSPTLRTLVTVTGSGYSTLAGGLDVTNSNEIRTNGNRVNYNLTVYASGTVYSMTSSDAAVDFGTTDPTLTLDKAGTYLIMGRAYLKYNAATFVANQTATVKLRRTNNTAADVSAATTTASLRIITTITDSVGIMSLPPVIYTTANTNDAIAVYGSLSATPSAGSVDVVEASVVAVRLY